MFDARKRMRERELNQDSSFGAALQRLRLQKHVSRQDFPRVSAKTIARIERGEVEHPHSETLEIIARKLGVRVEEIGSFWVDGRSSGICSSSVGTTSEARVWTSAAS